MKLRKQFTNPHYHQYHHGDISTHASPFNTNTIVIKQVTSHTITIQYPHLHIKHFLEIHISASRLSNRPTNSILRIIHSILPNKHKYCYDD